MDIKKSFGQKIREFRKNLGLSQEELAKRAGLHRTYIGIVERGEKNICLENIDIVAKSLNVKVKDLFS